MAERTVFLFALVLLVGSSASLAAAFIKQQTVVVPASGGSYDEGILGQPTHVNPITASTEADKSLVRLLFAGLADLADKITSDKENRNWNIRLKENLRWSDGEKITSDDVIFTVQKIQESDSNSPLYASWQGIGINRVSELEFQITLGSSYVFFQQNLKGLYVVPKHLFAETPVGNWGLSRYNLQPVGSGPYAFNSYETREDGFITAYRLKPNKFYFASRPLITNFSLKFFTDADKMVDAFNSGQIDGFAVDSGYPGDIKRTYETHRFFLPSYYAVFFNQGQNLVLQDKKVRQALSMAVDRKALLDDVLGGEGEIRFGPVSPSILSAQEERINGTSVDAATQLLENAGWSIGSSTIRQKSVKGGKINLEFNLTVPQIPFLVKTAGKLQSGWAALGAKVNLVSLDVKDVAGDTIKNRNYQALLFGNMPNPPADFFSFWHSSQRFYPGLNLSLYNNKQVDSLIASINQSDNDSDKQSADIQRLETAIENDYPAVFLYSPYYAYFSRKDLQGVRPGLIDEPADRFGNVSGWYLKTARSLK